MSKELSPYPQPLHGRSNSRRSLTETKNCPGTALKWIPKIQLRTTLPNFLIAGNILIAVPAESQI
jgi:hypothetical protein